MNQKPYRPTAATLRAVVDYMDRELDLQITGQCIDLETGQQFPSLMNYDADDVVKYRELIRRDALWTDH